MPSLWDALRQYLRDAGPGGVLNPEVTPQGLLDTASLASAPVPIAGDIIGLLADANRMRDPSERTATNFGLMALGALPLVPSGLGKARKALDKTDDAKRLTKVFHGSPSGEIYGAPRLSPHDENGLLGFSVSRSPETAKSYAYDQLGRRFDLEPEQMSPVIAEFLLAGRTPRYESFVTLMQKKLQKPLHKTSWEEILTYARKHNVTGVDHSRNLGIDEIQVIDPDSLRLLSQSYLAPARK